MGGIALQPEGEAGRVVITEAEETVEVASALVGRVSEQLRDKTAEVVLKPFDNWSNLPLLYPASFGITTSGNPGALAIGTRPHPATVALPASGVQVWAPDGRLYQPVRAAVVGVPSFHLGVGKALFGDMRISCIGDVTKSPGDNGFLWAGSTITENGAADPGGAFRMDDFVRGKWLGAWGAAAGFGGDGGNAMEAEDEWTGEVTVKFSPRKVQGLTKFWILDSVNVAVKFRPVGPQHSQILAQIETHTQGQRLGSADLTLTGPGGKTITLKHCEPKGVGFEFGGTALGTGEVAFVVDVVPTGVGQGMNPILIFSA